VGVLAERLKERIYAGLSVLAVTLGLALSGTPTAGPSAVAIAGTAVGLWLATIIAELLSHRVTYGVAARGRDLWRMFYVSAPLLTAAVGPLILIGVAALGLLPLVTALYIAVAVDTVSLFVWGLVSGLRMKAGVGVALLSGMANLAIGGLVIVVKLAAGH
jgi:hypothetical protein